MKKRLGQKRAEYSKSENNKGYIIIRTESPEGKAVWVLEHRYVKSIELGRELQRHECVHHKNGNRKDNSPDNLEIMSAVDHAKLHAKLQGWMPAGKRTVSN